MVFVDSQAPRQYLKMAKLQHNVRECIRNLSSSKVTERKKYADEFSNYIHNEQIIKIINAATDQDPESQFSWNAIFGDIHKAVLFECDKIYESLSKGKRCSNVYENRKMTFTSLLITVAKISNRSGVRLNGNTLTNAVLNVLESSKYRKLVADAYISLLRENVLVVRQYWGQIYQHWFDLYEAFEQMYGNPPNDKCSKSIIIDALTYIVKIGCENSDLVVHVKKRIFSFLKNVMNDAYEQKDLNFQRKALLLVLTACEQLKTESRIAICKFSEECLPVILNAYELKTEILAPDKVSLFDFFLLIIRIHHPDGVLEDNPASYAYQWTEWKQQVRKIYHILTKEISLLQKTRKMQQIHSTFVDLCVDVMKQVFSYNVDFMNSSSTISLNYTIGPEYGSCKRRRIVNGFPEIIDYLKQLQDPSDMWPWLSILSAFLSKYPTLVKEEDYILLLKACSEFMNTCKSPAVIDNLFRCCVILINIRKTLNMNNVDVELEMSFWHIIWDILLRTIGLNQSLEYSHLLVRKLLPVFTNLSASNVLRIYVSGVIRLSSDSLQTLHFLRHKMQFPDTIVDIPVSENLLNWLLPIKENLLITELDHLLLPTDLLAEILIDIVVKNKILESQHLSQNFFKNDDFIDINTLYSLSAFETFLPIDNNDDVSNGYQNSKFMYNEVALSKLIQLLLDTGRLLFSYHQESKESCILYFSSFAKLLLSIKKYSALGHLYLNERIQELTNDIIRQFVQDITMVLNNDAADSSEHLKMIEILSDFYECISSLPSIIAKSVRDHPSCSGRQILSIKQVSATLTSSQDLSNDSFQHDETDSEQFEIDFIQNDKIDGSVFSEDNLTAKERINMKVTKLLKNYCYHIEEISFEQCEFLKSLLLHLCDENFDCSTSCNLQMCMLVASSSLEIKNLNENNLILIIKIINNMCNEWYTCAEATLSILKLIGDATRKAVCLSEEACLNLKDVINNFHNRLAKDGRYGPVVLSHIVKCLSLFHKEALLNKFGDEFSPEEIFSYLTSPFHVVRMTAAALLSPLFTLAEQNEKGNRMDHGKMLVNFENAIFKAFIVNDIADEEKADEAVNRPVSVLYSLSSIIIHCSKTRRPVLYRMFYITSQKNLNSELVRKVLHHIQKTMKLDDIIQLLQDNMSYIIWQWYTQYKNLSNFPWASCPVASEADFYQSFRNQIIPVVIHKGDTDSLAYICGLLNVSQYEIVKICFPYIMALLLPQLSNKNVEFMNVANSDCVHEILVEILGNDMIEDLMLSMLPDVMVGIIRTLHEPSFGVVEGCIMPEPELIHFNYQQIEHTIACLQETSPEPNTPLFVHLSGSYSSHMQKILSKLYADIHSASAVEIRLASLQRYIFFCEMWLKYYKQEKLLEQMPKYLARTVIHNLLNLITCQGEETSSRLISLCSVKFFSKFVKIALEVNGDVINKYLSTIVGKLVPIIQQRNKLGKLCLDILTELLVNQSEKLSDGISTLDPFPDTDLFANISNMYEEFQISQKSTDTGLEYRIKQFLRAGRENPHPTCRFEGLRQLRKQLSDNKNGILILYENLKTMRGFSEDCSNSLLHQLICMLVQLTRIPDKMVKIEAVCCLGEIGILDLQTLVLQPDLSSDMDCNNFTPICQLISETLKLLSEYIIDSDIRVVKAANDSLYALFSNKLSQNLIKHLEKNFDVGFIYPFTTVSVSSQAATQLDSSFDLCSFKMKVADNYLWCPDIDRNVTHQMWITNLVCALLDSFPTCSYFQNLQSVCKAKVKFAEEIMPYLVYLMLTLDNGKFKQDVEEIKQTFSVHINLFFERHFITVSESKAGSSSSQYQPGKQIIDIHLSKSSVQCLLKVVHFLRQKQKNPQLCVLNLNYLHIAQAAQFCSSYFTSLMYAELWINDNIRLYDISHNGSILSTLDDIADRNPEEKDTFLLILREAFVRIGDSDAIFGCGSSMFLNPETRIEYYRQTGRWSCIAEQSDARFTDPINRNNQSYIRDYASSLNALGLYNLENSFLSSLPILDDESKNHMYECYWRLKQWNYFEPDNPKTFSYQRYMAIQNIDQKNYLEAVFHISQARESVIPTLSEISLESTKNIYSFLSILQCLQELEDFTECKDVEEISAKWKTCTELNRTLNFTYVEPLHSQRMILLDNSKLGLQFRLDTLSTARREQHYNFASRCLPSPDEHLTGATELTRLRLKSEEAQLYWDRGDKLLSRHLLNDLIHQVESLKNVSLFHSSILQIYGDWLLQTNLENADVILQKYFIRCLDIINNESHDSLEEQKTRQTIYKNISEFAHYQYKEVTEYVKSSTFAEKVKNANDQPKAELNKKLSKDHLKAAIFHNKQQANDDQEVKEILQKQNKYLILAIRYYLKRLIRTEGEDLSVFQVISLWLDNNMDKNLQKELLTIHQIPSYKFINVLPQIIPHINHKSSDNSAQILNSLIERCALEHPYHTIPLLLSLSNFSKDNEYNKHMLTNKNMPEEARCQTSKKMIKKFKKDTRIGKIVTEMDDLSEAYISLAYYNFPSNPTNNIANKKIPIPINQKIMTVKNFSMSSCPTMNIPVKVNCDYSDIIGVSSFEKYYICPGGINAPKKIICLCSDGFKRAQLVKGQDDLRQDAVMQQVFNTMNKLLSENRLTSNRKLLIRTYKVVPLSQRSGVLEWCNNATSLSEYLSTGANGNLSGAHKRYHPTDLNHLEARRKISDAAKSCADERLEVFKFVCGKIQPVFRFFFLEKFPSPTMWFERKLAYIHSLATTSIVGYILGIGDRHPSNILIDEKTADLIHIDFGVAFEQGLLLNTPELVPFRLTRDMEDGMGVFALDGIFRRCCEKTLTVLRQNKNIIKTTLEVFLYDPLHVWTLSPDKAAAIQNTDAHNIQNKILSGNSSHPEFNKTAERALTRIKLKLEGLEDGTPTNIEGQVNRLIQVAKDPNNLSKMFSGWQAFL